MNTKSAARNLPLKIGGYTIRPDWDRIARIGGAGPCCADASAKSG